jgi:hypothetical protein
MSNQGVQQNLWDKAGHRQWFTKKNLRIPPDKRGVLLCAKSVNINQEMVIIC